MKYRKFTEEEKKYVIGLTQEFLRNLSVEVNFGEDFRTIFCRNMSTNEKWEEYIYTITISNNDEKVDVRQSNKITTSIDEVAWLVAYTAFKKFDNDYSSVTAKDIWENKVQIIKNWKEQNSK